MLTCGDMQTIQVLLATVATDCSFREVVASLTVIKIGEFTNIDRSCLINPWNSDAAVLGLVFDGLPFGRPALSATRTGPLVPAHSGDDQGNSVLSRSFWRTRSVPRFQRSGRRGVLELTCRHSCLSDCRTPAASRRARVPLFVRIAAAILARERQGLRPLVPETANRRPRVAG